MRRLATLAVVAALMSSTVASGQDYTFGDWARDHGYSPGDVMPGTVNASQLDENATMIDSLEGINDFDWTTTPTTQLWLHNNQLSSIESGAFSGLTNLRVLRLDYNQISSIESDDFSGLTNLGWLWLHNNQLSSIESGAFSGLTNLEAMSLDDNQLTSIDSDDFSGLANLADLSLSYNQLSSIKSGTFSGLTSLTSLDLDRNDISNIESGAFSGLTNLTWLDLDDNQISSIESGAFSGLTNLMYFHLRDNTALTDLNLETADFSSLTRLDVKGNVNITSVSLANAVLTQRSLVGLLSFCSIPPFCGFGIGDLFANITDMDLSGIDFGDITDLEPLYTMDDLTDLWFVDTQNVDATALDVLLNNLETIEGIDTEGILYMTQADFDAFNTTGGDLLSIWNDEPGHHVEYLSIGDVNHDTEINGLDVDPFVDVLLASQFDVAADMNGDGAVNGLDVDPFVEAVVAGDAQAVPEFSTLLLTLITMGVLGGWRKWSE